jgi:hypothetical protein
MWIWSATHTSVRQVVGELLRTFRTSEFPLRTTIDPYDPNALDTLSYGRKPWNELLDELKGTDGQALIPQGVYMKRHAALARYFEEPHKFYVVMVPDMQPLTGPISRQEALDRIRDINSPHVAQKVKRKEL